MTVANLQLTPTRPTEWNDHIAPPVYVSRRRSFVEALFVQLRPKQWVKNGLVFAAPLGAGAELHWMAVRSAVMAFFALSLIASATYIINDLQDIEADRCHPTKCRRPLAAGELTPGVATVLCAVSALAGIVLGFAAGGTELLAVLAAYVVLSISYTWWFKHQEVLDVSTVACCFLLRVVAGAVATKVTLPHGMLLCTGFGALFMVIGKRYAEFRTLGDAAQSHRRALSVYSESYLRSIFYLAAGATVISYGHWAFERSANVGVIAGCFQLSIVPVVIMVLQYALLVDRGEGGSPEVLVLSSRRLQVMGLAAGALFALGGLHGIHTF